MCHYVARWQQLYRHSKVDPNLPSLAQATPPPIAEAFLIICHVDGADHQFLADVTRFLKSKDDRFPQFIFISSSLSLEQQKELLAAGAIDILERPLNIQRLRYLIESQKISHLHWQKRRDPSMQLVQTATSHLDQKIKKIANVNANILLTGETGVGKTFYAEKIHHASKRRKHRFVVVDCSSFPSNLIESELFGHAKGSFTDATSKKIGQFEYAGAGTILLDEIDTLSPSVQAKLLRVVEKKEFRPVGENKSIPMKARIISATNLNLEELVEQKLFRADLFFRLNAYEINIPSLRDRKNEIEPLCHLFAEQFAQENNSVKTSFTTEVMDLLKEFTWPGNLRELRNCVFHGTIDSDDSIVQVENLPEKLIRFRDSKIRLANRKKINRIDATTASQSVPFDPQMYKEARRLIMALENNHYNRSLTAKELGVSRMTVYNRMKRHELG